MKSGANGGSNDLVGQRRIEGGVRAQVLGTFETAREASAKQSSVTSGLVALSAQKEGRKRHRREVQRG